MKTIDPTRIANPMELERAAESFLRHELEDWQGRPAATGDAVPEPSARVLNLVEQAWQATEEIAASPELIALREQALARMRHAQASRWLRGPKQVRAVWPLAAAVAVMMVGAAVWYLHHRDSVADTYQTGVGEQRLMVLEDQSRVALDAQTQLRILFDESTRRVELLQGQAQFTVAADPRRPFEVTAGDHTIVALGTEFTVEYVDHQMRVALLDGKVAVMPVASVEGAAAAAIRDPGRQMGIGDVVELVPGEVWTRHRDGRVTVRQDNDPEVELAWRQGKVVFRDESLGEAVRRINRYSPVPLQITDPALLSLKVSGMFEVGDTHAFSEAVQAYLPVYADYSQPGLVQLKPVPAGAR